MSMLTYLLSFGFCFINLYVATKIKNLVKPLSLVFFFFPQLAMLRITKFKVMILNLNTGLYITLGMTLAQIHGFIIFALISGLSEFIYRSGGLSLAVRNLSLDGKIWT